MLVSEVDIASLLQAKAAIAAGIETLLAAASLRPQDIGILNLAGGFGFSINVRHAIVCGLLPGFSPSQVRVVGNSSLAGAFLALADRSVFDEMKNLREKTDIRELNLDPDFESRYIDHLLLD